MFITEVLKLLFLWGCVFTRAFDELNIFKRCLFIEQLVFIVFPDFNRLKMSWWKRNLINEFKKVSWKWRIKRLGKIMG